MKPLKGFVIDENEQGSEAWLRARLGLFTASEAGCLMKRQRNGQPYATRKNYISELALQRITGQLPEQKDSETMREGKERERVAALAYSFHTGFETEQTGFWHNDIYGASPDDLIVGQLAGVEYKNPLSATHYQTLQDQNIPEHYYWQIVQNLLVTGADFWDYVSYHPGFPHNSQLFIKRVTRDAALDDIKKLEAEIHLANQEVEKQIKFINEYEVKI